MTLNIGRHFRCLVYLTKTENMKQFFLFLVLICSETLISQEISAYDLWDNDYDKGIAYYKQGNFADAITWLEKAKTHLNQANFSSSKDTEYYPVYHYDHLGSSYYQTSQFEKAAEHYLLALNSIRTIENPDKEYSKKLLNSVVFSYEKYDTDKAILLLDTIISKIKSSGNHKNTDYAELLFKRFQVYVTQKNVNGIMENLTEAYNLHQELGSTNHKDIPSIIYNLAYNYYDQKEYSKALTYFKKTEDYITAFEAEPSVNVAVLNYDYTRCALAANALDDAQKKCKTIVIDAWGKSQNRTDKDYAKQLVNDVTFAYEKLDAQKALQFLEDIIHTITSIDKKTSAAIAELLFTKFQIHKAQNNTEGILSSLEKAYAIHEEMGTTNHQHVPFIVFNLAYTYYFQNNFFDALNYFKKSDEFVEVYKSQGWANMSKLNYDYALSYFKENDFINAEKKYSSLINDKWLSSPENAEFNLYAYYYLGLSLYYQDKVEASLSIYKKGIAHLAELLEAKDPLLALQKTNLTSIFIYTEQYDEALSLSDEVYTTMRNSEQTQTQAYINAVNNLGLLYMYKAEFGKAEKFLKEALEITQKEFNLNPVHMADIKSNLAYVYQKISNYREAKKYHEEALDIKSKFLYPNSPEYAKALQNYGVYLYETGEHVKSEEYLKKANNIFVKNNDVNSLSYAGLLNNLGVLYTKISRVKNSLKSYNKAIEIYEKKQLTTSESYTNLLNGKANCLIKLGNKASALKIGKQAFEIIKANYDEASLQYGDALLSYGEILRTNGNFTASQDCFSKAYEIFGNYFDYGTPRFVAIVNYYISDLVIDKKYDDALRLLEKIEENIITTYGFESFDYAQTLSQKALIASISGDYDYAIRLYESVSSVYQKTIARNSDKYSNMLFNYAEILNDANKIEEAIKTFKEYNSGMQDVLKDVFTYRSESDKQKFLKQLQNQNSSINAHIFQNNNAYSKLTTIGLNNQLMLKSLLLNASRAIISNLSKSEDISIKEKVDRYGVIKFQLSDPKVLGDKERTTQLRTELNTLETELVQIHDQQFGGNTTDNFNRDLVNIKAKLKPNDIAIEFVEFETREGNLPSRQKVYGAYLIKADTTIPVALQLFMAEDLKDILKNQTPNTLYQTRGSQGGSSTDTKGLYDLIWAPIEPYLEGIETIYFSPTGLLNQIPFAALDTTDKPILASQYNLVQLSSTYSLTEPTANPNTTNTLFIGGIDYEYTSSSSSTTSDTASNLAMLKSVSGTRSMGSKWNYLPGTLDEVSSIKNLFKDNGKTHTLLSSKEATETIFKQLSGNSPNTIHIATHGFFFENPKTNTSETLDISSQNIYKASEDPLLRSGLIFAGANEAWTKGANLNSEDDGILTALEISNLDLSNTDLVVLSACETGLGDIDGSEGVYGLQRAFKMAGVDLIIMSLWEVPDTETAEFMQSFYSNWLSGQEIRQAFRNTQLTMAKKYEDNPEKWAAFVLFE